VTDDTTESLEQVADLELDAESADAVKGGMLFRSKTQDDHRRSPNFAIR
jgi:hypothetical protein